jgi:hypothetical protein
MPEVWRYVSTGKAPIDSHNLFHLACAHLDGTIDSPPE